MLHLLYRFARAALAYVGVVIVFTTWGIVAAVMSDHFWIVPAAMAGGAILFAPAAALNTWADIGDE